MPELAFVLGVLIDNATERLRRSGLPEPRRQAVRIWTELTESGPADVFLQRDQPINSAAAENYQCAVLRRCGGEPHAHVTGWCGFRRNSLRSDQRALIPRPETEGLVELVLQRVRTGVVADVGTGSGCIALSLALEGSFDQVIGLDSSAEALELAGLNRRQVDAAVTLIQADLCAPLRLGALDAIVSNPPYLTEGEYAALESSVRDWEPAAALVSGEDGMVATTRLLREGRDVLRPGGWLALEVDSSRASTTARLAGELGWSDVTVQVDLFGRERYLLARRSVIR
jgi:release factor glutamine methyltransferase